MGDNAKKRARESKLLAELSQKHGYTLADTLPSKDRIVMFMHTENGKRQIDAAIVVKLIVPANSALGKAIQARRDGKTKKGRK